MVGFAVSAIGTVAAFVPNADVVSVARYELKLVSGALLPLAVGLAFFIRAQRKVRRTQTAVEEVAEPA